MVVVCAWCVCLSHDCRAEWSPIELHGSPSDGKRLDSGLALRRREPHDVLASERAKGDRMKWARWVTPVAAMGIVLVASGGKAAAHLESTNGCQGSGTFRESGLNVDAKGIGDQVVVIPYSDTVDWQG